MSWRSQNFGAWAACVGMGVTLTVLTIPIGLGAVRLCIWFVEAVEDHVQTTLHGAPRRDLSTPRGAVSQTPAWTSMSVHS